MDTSTFHSLFGPPTPHDWPEDYEHENGRYASVCPTCNVIFVGHKRRHWCRVCSTPPSIRIELAALRAAVAPLVAIANAYDANSLDDEARKRWGVDLEFSRDDPPPPIDLYHGRGGRTLLTLQHCLAARAAVEATATTAANSQRSSPPHP